MPGPTQPGLHWQCPHEDVAESTISACGSQTGAAHRVGMGVVVVAGMQVSIGGSAGPLRPKQVLLLESSRVQARLLALNTQ